MVKVDAISGRRNVQVLGKEIPPFLEKRHHLDHPRFLAG